jgi:glycosyltransferase involved in cell wall biosynthesis
MKFSIIIPARDEEKYIGECLDSIDRAAEFFPCEKEVIVVLNRCTDRTETIARAHGAIIVHDDSKCLARIRNTGAKRAMGEILVTIDADSRMSFKTFAEIARALESGKYIGGGVPIRPERWSLGILVSVVFLFAVLVPLWMSAGLFWCYRKDFESIGGFDEAKAVAEDVDFARRLRAHGQPMGKRYGTLRRAPMITSCRKFDRFGDWFTFRLMLTRPRVVMASMKGRNRELADELFYDFKR